MVTWDQNSVVFQKFLSRPRSAFLLAQDSVIKPSFVLDKTPIVGVHWAADCVMQWFIILGSID